MREVCWNFSPKFLEYYSNTVLKMNSVLDSGEEDMDEMEQIMEAIEELDSKSIPIHWSHRQHR